MVVYRYEMTSKIPDVEELHESSKRYARDALKVYGTDENERFAAYAVTSLEHIAKACLLNKNPALLVELRSSPLNEASLLALSGAKPLGLERLRTVGVEVALERLRNLAVIGGNLRELTQLIELRNGHTHLAQGASEDEELLVAFITQVEAILDDLGKDKLAYWSDMSEWVTSAKQESAEKVARIVARKIAQSKVNFAAKIAGMEPGIVVQFRDSQTLPDENGELCRCPVCGSNGFAIGEHQMAYDEEDGVVSMWVEFWAESFKCPNCLLSLSSDSEMEEAGMETVIVSDRDADDYFEYDTGEID